MNMRIALVGGLAAVFCSGCFLSPGMKMDEDALHERGKGNKDEAKFRVVLITPQVLLEQARKTADAEKAAHGQGEAPAAPAGYEYRVSPHDVLSVIVWEHPELTIPAGEFRSAETTGYPVSADGNIFFPNVGVLHVAGKTPDEVRRDLTAKLALVVREPQLQVLTASYRGKRAMVAGEVLQPSAVHITDVPLRVQDAIAFAKGFTADADPASVTLTREGVAHHFDLSALYERGDISQNWVLQDGDIVHVADRSRNRIFVIGEVRKPATRYMQKGRLTLADAIADLTEMDLVYANPGQIFVFRGQYDAPDAYVRQNVERKSEEAEQTLQFITSQMPELKARLDKSEEALNVYRSKHGTIDLPLESKAAIEGSVTLEKTATELQLQRAELRQRFTDSHPMMSAVNKKLAEVDSERQAMAARLKNMPESELNSVRLMRDVKVNNELYVLLLNKAQELRVVKSGTIGNVRVLDRAFVPRKPVSPLLGQTLGLSFVLGLALGVMAAFARRALNRGIEDPDVIEAATGLSVYATVPHSKVQDASAHDKAKGPSAHLLAVRDPSDLAIESLRSLRTSLQFALMDSPNGVVAISGPSPNIGKSFVSTNFAQVLADSGKRVLLIDGDMRNGSLHNVFGFAREKGLSEVVAGSLDFADAIHVVTTNLHVLTQGQIPPNPSELLMSAHFRELIEKAAKTYDLVVIDTPPILAVTDAAIIGRLSGVMLLVLRAGKHPLREVTLTLKRFAQSGVKVSGMVFNDVVRLSKAYGYGYGYVYDYRQGTKAG